MDKEKIIQDLNHLHMSIHLLGVCTLSHRCRDEENFKRSLEFLKLNSPDTKLCKLLEEKAFSVNNEAFAELTKQGVDRLYVFFCSMCNKLVPEVFPACAETFFSVLSVVYSAEDAIQFNVIKSAAKVLYEARFVFKSEDLEDKLQYLIPYYRELIYEEMEKLLSPETKMIMDIMSTGTPVGEA